MLLTPVAAFPGAEAPGNAIDQLLHEIKRRFPHVDLREVWNNLNAVGMNIDKFIDRFPQLGLTARSVLPEGYSFSTPITDKEWLDRTRLEARMALKGLFVDADFERMVQTSGSIDNLRAALKLPPREHTETIKLDSVRPKAVRTQRRPPTKTCTLPLSKYIVENKKNPENPDSLDTLGVRKFYKMCLKKNPKSSTLFQMIRELGMRSAPDLVDTQPCVQTDLVETSPTFAAVSAFKRDDKLWEPGRTNNFCLQGLKFPPSGKTPYPLSDDQYYAVAMLADRPGVIAVHGTGFGKTLLAAAATYCWLVSNPSHTVTFVAPASLKANFITELSLWKNIAGTPSLNNRVHAYTFSDYERKFTTGTLMGPHGMADCGGCAHSLLISDEAHNLCNTESRRFEVVYKCSQICARVLLLTATPMVNSPKDILALVAIAGGMSPAKLAHWNTTWKNESTVPDEIRTEYSRLFHFNRITRDVANQFPITATVDWAIPMNPEAEAIYTQLEAQNLHATNIPEHLRTLYIKRNETGEEKITTHSFYQGLRRSVGLSIQEGRVYITRYEALRRFIRTYVPPMRASETPPIGSPDRIRWINDLKKFVVYTEFLSEGIAQIEAILKSEGIPYGVITGSVSKTNRQKRVDDYNNRVTQCLVISRAGGEGLDLQCTRYVVMMEPPWKESAAQQVSGRGVRRGSHQELTPENQTCWFFRFHTVKQSEFAGINASGGIMQYILKSSAENSVLSVDLYIRSLALSKQVNIDRELLKIKVGAYMALAEFMATYGTRNGNAPWLNTSDISELLKQYTAHPSDAILKMITARLDVEEPTEIKDISKIVDKEERDLTLSQQLQAQLDALGGTVPQSMRECIHVLLRAVRHGLSCIRLLETSRSMLQRGAWDNLAKHREQVKLLAQQMDYYLVHANNVLHAVPLANEFVASFVTAVNELDKEFYALKVVLDTELQHIRAIAKPEEIEKAMDDVIAQVNHVKIIALPGGEGSSDAVPAEVWDEGADAIDELVNAAESLDADEDDVVGGIDFLAGVALGHAMPAAFPPAAAPSHFIPGSEEEDDEMGVEALMGLAPQ